MQLIKHEHIIDADKLEKKAARKFQLQLVFSVLSVACLAAAIVCGAMMR